MNDQIIKIQAARLKRICNIKDTYKKSFNDFDITIFPKVYSAGADSSLLYETVQVYKDEKALDLCTGTGVIAFKLKKLGATDVIAIDINPEAIKNTLFNRKVLNQKITVIEGDLFEPVKDRKFDVITINPPFTNKRPQNKIEMMFWDEEYSLIKRFFSELPKHLNRGGRAYLSWSSFGDNKLLEELAKKNGFNIKKVGNRTGKHEFTYYVYLIVYNNDHSRILQGYTDKKIEIYDFNLKYGDWIFKRPLLNSIRKAGYTVFQNSKHKLAYIDEYEVSAKHIDIALIFTRNKKEDTKYIIKKHETVIEIRRLNRFEESVLVWSKGKLLLTKTFKQVYEEDRVFQITSFLGFEYLSIEQYIIEPENKTIAIYIGASENKKHRLSLDSSQIVEFITKSNEFGYKHKLLVEDKSSEINKILSEVDSGSVEICYTNNINKAFKIIDECSYYLGSDSGLAHYAVSKGKLCFSLYNSTYHTDKPLFSSKFYNHLTFFGNKRFIDEALYYLEFSRGKKRTLQFYESINFATAEGKYLLEDERSNRYKFFRMTSYLFSKNSDIQDELKKIPNNTTIFEPDHLKEVYFENVYFENKHIFISTKEVITDIYNLLLSSVPTEVFNKLEVWSKNCSFTYGVSLSQGNSDVDFLSIVGDLDQELKKKVYYGILRIYNKYNLSTALPHQLPRIIKEKDIHTTEPLILNGNIVFNESIPTDEKNIEKWKARIKAKIIFGLFSKEEINKLKIKCNSSCFPESTFSDELDVLIADNQNFEVYKSYISKIDSIIDSVNSYNRPSKIILSISKEHEADFIKTCGLLMSHGIIYIHNGLLYSIWDLRRPQHNWFIPIVININAKSLEDKLSPVLETPLFQHSSFLILKNIKQEKLSNQELFYLLGSDSFIITNEVYRYLFNHKETLDLHSIVLKREDKDSYIKNNKSNAEEGIDKAISLFNTMYPNFLKLNKEEISYLSKYNLFSYSIYNLDTFRSNETSFYIINTTDFETLNVVENDFYSYFVSLLREYYIYIILGLKREEQLKKREILFAYFVRGRSLMEGPLKQSEAVRTFLERVPIHALFKDIYWLQKTIRSLAEVKCLSLSSNFLPQYILSKKNVVNKNNSHPNNFSIFKKFETAYKVLTAENWNVWKQTDEYLDLLKEKDFRGAFLVTIKGRKVPVFIYENFISDVLCFAFPQNNLEEMSISPAENMYGYNVVTPQEFTIALKSLYKMSPDLFIHTYKELKMGESIIIENRRFRINRIIGEGNYSVVYKGSKFFNSRAIKLSLVPLNSEYVTGKELCRISNLFIRYRDLNVYRNVVLLDLINGQTLAKSNVSLTDRQISDIFRVCVLAFMKKVSFGDLTPNNLMINKQKKITLIDPHFFFPLHISFLKDVLGLVYIIYFNKHKDRFLSYWPLRTDIIIGKIQNINQLINEINTVTDIDDDTKKKFNNLFSKYKKALEKTII